MPRIPTGIAMYSSSGFAQRPTVTLSPACACPVHDNSTSTPGTGLSREVSLSLRCVPVLCVLLRVMPRVATSRWDAAPWFGVDPPRQRTRDPRSDTRAIARVVLLESRRGVLPLHRTRRALCSGVLGGCHLIATRGRYDRRPGMGPALQQLEMLHRAGGIKRQTEAWSRLPEALRRQVGPRGDSPRSPLGSVRTSLHTPWLRRTAGARGPLRAPQGTVLHAPATDHADHRASPPWLPGSGTGGHARTTGTHSSVQGYRRGHMVRSGARWRGFGECAP